jgi:hypothetical protein
MKKRGKQNEYAQSLEIKDKKGGTEQGQGQGVAF